MGFKRKYADGYHGAAAFLEDSLFGHLMNRKQRRDLAFSYGKKRKQQKSFVDELTVQTSTNHYLVDLTSISCVTLDTKKNRFLQNELGYFRYSFVGAKNILSNRKYMMFVKGCQLKERDLRSFRELIKQELGYYPVFVTDNQHTLSLIAKKKVTMWIEVEFGGIKTKLYKTLRPLQHIKNNRVYTDISFKDLMHLYLKRLGKCGFKLLGKRRVNDLTGTKILMDA